jgi:hypothetical protein
MIMSVQCCWEGFEVARELGWMDLDCLDDDASVQLACKTYEDILAMYDAAWVFPGEIIISSDPVTTFCDPKPWTCKRMLPVQTEEEFSDQVSSSTDDKVSCTRYSAQDCQNLPVAACWCGKGDEDARSDSTPDPPPIACDPSLSNSERSDLSLISPCSPTTLSTRSSKDSLMTVNKQYKFNKQFTPLDQNLKAKSFVEFMQDCDVKVMVRSNLTKEGGMLRTSYDGKSLAPFGIRHEEITIIDKRGGLPKPMDVARMLEIMDDTLEGAILIHCKGGFGRSAVLACCSMIKKYNVSGRALLGWVRVARPGSITNPDQERFLCSLNGAADLLRFAKLPLSQISGDGVSDGWQGCRPGCTVM